MQLIYRKGSFDSGHRVMNEKFKCFNLHGHTYLYTLTFEYEESQEIGYAMDFKEIKRVGMQFIDDKLDHGMLLNPLDTAVLDAVQATGSKLWTMSLNGHSEYCNPSVENIAKEVFLAMEVLFVSYEPNFKIHSVTIDETPNCGTVCYADSINEQERKNWLSCRLFEVQEYANSKGVLNYDNRIDPQSPISN